MNRSMLIGLAVGLVVGVFIGYQAGLVHVAARRVGRDGRRIPPGAAPGMPPPGMGGARRRRPGDNFQARITAMQSVVARDPKNFDAWVQLGNDYFDTRQPQKAIDAYARALELKPNNANVLTDQGVMYRDIGQFDKAIANFTKANQSDPKHVQSLYNLGRRVPERPESAEEGDRGLEQGDPDGAAERAGGAGPRRHRGGEEDPAGG